ncbi:RHS repeat domain-containing protein, partial [[Flexibacter] sp. ATCC 35208]|uniref:RHS repeat domain-containing protein n=1 Tax=[Flexibacter] sp. ATCC 35208 TaxID=1936242 RepID=UPI0009C48447
LQTWYVRDAGGNVLSVYNYGDTAINSGDLSQTEAHLYGSSRLGMATMSVNVQDTTPDVVTNITGLGTGKNIIFTRGKKFFELTNHLGNVLATVSDRKIQVSGNGTTIDYYNADVVSAQDYYPFGMIQPGRSYNAGGYRYGFNGKENDNEVKGEGNEQDYGMRVYDPRVGRFLSVDPITTKYPFLTPYQFASNSPILCVDVDGLEGDPFTIGRAVSSNREWEANVRKTDPEHANQRIYEANKEAFLTVGSMLTSGSGSLFNWFLRGVAAYGTYKVTRGVIKQDAADVKDGVNSLLFVALSKASEIVTKKIISFAFPRLYNFGTKALGEMGAEALVRKYGTFQPVGKGSGVPTSTGTRYLDGIPLGTTLENIEVAFESKVGYQKYSGNIVAQVEKDAELLASGRVKEVTWVFWRSPSTGKVGASPELLKELKIAGIKTEIAGDIPKDIINKAIIKYAPTNK